MQVFLLYRFHMLKIYLYKCILTLSLFVFSITSTLSSEKETSATKRPIEDTVVASENEAEKPAETLLKKKQRVERSQDEEEIEATEEEVRAAQTLSYSQRETIEKSVNIGTWVGNTENGIADFQLSYNSSILFKEIIDWHIVTGNLINKIINHLGPDWRAPR